MWESFEKLVYRSLVVVTLLFVATGVYYLLRRIVVGRWISG